MAQADFMKTALLEKRSRTLKEHDVIQLCQEDQEQLAEHLLNPPQTLRNFKKLMAWRKQQEQNAKSHQALTPFQFTYLILP